MCGSLHWQSMLGSIQTIVLYIQKCEEFILRTRKNITLARNILSKVLSPIYQAVEILSGGRTLFKRPWNWF